MTRYPLALLARVIALSIVQLAAGCGNTSGGTPGNTELNVVIPNNAGQSSAPGAFDIQIVEYTIACNDGNTPGPFLDNNATFDDDVTISGVLEVLDSADPGVTNQDFGPDLSEVYVFQGFMDLPPTAGCAVQLRARDNNGEVICTATEPFDINADSTTTVNVVLYCSISFQAPVGMLDLNADFSFNVGNFCPDLFVLNCVDSELDVQSTPFGDFMATACQVRFRDGDSECGDSCDPQTCVTTPEGLTCTPGPDPGVSTTVTCASTLGACAISCDGANPAAECVFTGDTLGTIGDPAPGPGAPGVGGFFVSCATFDHDNDPNTPELPLTPGDDIVCAAVTTDGDVDCDKTKTVDLTIPGIPPCGAFVAGGGSCADGNSCTEDVCVDVTCDGTVGNCCINPISPEGQYCTDGGGFPGTCDDAGLCVSTNCNAQSDPAAFCDDGSECTANACEADGSCSATPINPGGSCSCDGSGDGGGICNGFVCDGLDTCDPGDISVCPAPGECFDGSCGLWTPPTSCGQPFTCGSEPSPLGTPCTSVPGGACDGAGTCAAPPTLAAGTGTTSWQALPTTATGCDYDATSTICSNCTITGPSVPGGGQCGQFGAQIVGGCEVPGGVLNAQLAIDVTIDIDVVSDGAGNLTHDFTVRAENPALGTAAGLVSVDTASLFALNTTGNPSSLQNDLNPAIAALPPAQRVLGAFTGGGNVLLLDSDDTSVPGFASPNGDEIPTATTAFVPTSSPTVDINYQTFSLLMTIVASGTPLLVNDAGCIFDNPGAPMTFTVQ